MNKRYFLAIVLIFILSGKSSSQNDFEKWREKEKQELENYKEQKKNEFEAFRQKRNEEYAQFLQKRWEEFNAFRGIEPPKPKPVPPVVCPEEDRHREHRDEKKLFEDVVEITPPKPQPMPIEPVKISPPAPHQESISSQFFGTQVSCTVNEKPAFTLSGIGESQIAEAWQQLSDGKCEDLLAQCLAMRSRYRLNDWGYIQLLDSMSQAATHSSVSRSASASSPNLGEQQKNKATLLMAWLYCQSGYKMRLARADGRLYMLFASENIIYKHNWFTIDGEKFYPYKGDKLKELYICDASFPQEQSMTLRMGAEPLLATRMSNERTLQSKQYPKINVTATANKNLIDFYGDYPTGSMNDDFGTRWAMYANTPLSDEARQQLYPQLQKLLQGKSKLQATEELLNFVQTVFVYEYDSIVWGEDRAFFAEETLFYPYADCEDRSILFSRLVRDLLGLRVVLLYYPGHLATAVRFDGEQPTGDYLQLPDGRYFIADPTYIGAPIGLTMPQCKNDTVKVIVLE